MRDKPGQNNGAGVRASAMHALILACASGTLLAMAFPYPSLWPLAWVGLVPLLLALSYRRVLAGFGVGYMFGLVFLGITLRWSAEIDPLLWVGFTLIEALVCAIFGAVAAWFYSKPAGHSAWRPVAIATTWTLIEYLRMQGPYGLTWSELSYTQLPTEVIVQMADLTGTMGVSFLIVLVNAVLAEFLLWREQNGKRHTPPNGMRVCAIWSGVALLACVLYGSIRIFTLPSLTTDFSTIGCVQPNIDAYLKWDPKRLEDSLHALEEATARAANRGAYLVVWPETAVPLTVLRDAPTLARVQSLAARLGIYLLVGAPDRAPEGTVTNTAFLLDPHGQIQGRYDKIHLVPFGEFLPLRSVLGRIPIFASELPVDLTPGKAPYIFHTARFSFATLICFESTFSGLCREFVRQGAQLLVVITNDGWFRRTSAADHHLAMSAMRAIEERMWVIQCGNTGLSAFIDPMGRYRAESKLLTATELVEAVQPGSLGSVYQRFGDWFTWVLGALFIFCSVRHARGGPQSAGA